jgi:hypothetical protein
MRRRGLLFCRKDSTLKTESREASLYLDPRQTTSGMSRDSLKPSQDCGGIARRLFEKSVKNPKDPVERRAFSSRERSQLAVAGQQGPLSSARQRIGVGVGKG